MRAHVVEPLAIPAQRRVDGRPLHDFARKACSCPLEFLSCDLRKWGGGEHLALRVLGVTLFAELCAGRVSLRAGQVVLQPPAPATNSNDKEAGGERVKRAAMADLQARAPAELVAELLEVLFERPAYLSHAIKRRPVGWLMQHKKPIGQL